MKPSQVAAMVLLAIVLLACQAFICQGSALAIPIDPLYGNNTAGDMPVSPVPPGNSLRAVRPPGSEAVLFPSWPDASPGLWRVYYFATSEPQGPPLAEGFLPQAYLEAHWLDALTEANLASQALSATWVREAELSGGALRFYLWADGGVRLWVNGRLVIDRWESTEKDPAIGEIWLDQGGPTEVLLAYRDGRTSGRIKLRWERVLWFASWRGEYYPNRYLTGQPFVVRDDIAPRFDWGLEAPAPSLPADDFSVRWSRDLVLEPGCYRFLAEADDGVRVYVDEMLLINGWHDVTAEPLTREVWIPSGEHTLMIEYFDASGAAHVDVGWERLDGVAGEPGAPQGCGKAGEEAGSGKAEKRALADLVGNLRETLIYFYHRLVGPPVWW